MTASELKARYEEATPDGHFFERGSMRFFGDTMKNYGVRACRVKLWNAGELNAIELFRRRPVKNGLKSSHYFTNSGLHLHPEKVVTK